MPHLERITIYPIKSLPGVDRVAAEVLPSGGLAFDRRWAIVDKAGDWVNAKRTAAIHAIRARFIIDGERVAVALRRADEPESADVTFDLASERGGAEAWLSACFGLPVTLAERSGGGFPDDSDSPGPTIVSTASLEAVASWFPGLSVDEVRRRFRANLEIGGVQPFWEDRLVADEGRVVPFEIGGVRLEGTNPCQRCVVPTRDSLTGTIPLAGFAKAFAARREEALPAWAVAERFDHYYRLTVNTRPAPFRSTGEIRVGENVTFAPLQRHGH